LVFIGIARDACAGNATAGRDPRSPACDRGHAWREGTAVLAGFEA
jgi:hypothetical protein